VRSSAVRGGTNDFHLSVSSNIEVRIFVAEIGLFRLIFTNLCFDWAPS